jgi:hypothetical protein
MGTTVIAAVPLQVESPGGRSATPPSAVPSANAVYREFDNNPVDATAKYVDRIVHLQGRRGDVNLSDGRDGAVVHIADGTRPNALILSFPNRRQLQGIDKGALFRFTCTAEGYRYATLWLVGCSVDSGPVATALEPAAERPTVVDSLLSANALYRAFEKDAGTTSAKYVGQIMDLEGLRGELIPLDGMAAAVHIGDRFKSNALILSFPDRRQVAALEAGQRFRFRCTVDKFEYLIVWMKDCSVVR